MILYVSFSENISSFRGKFPYCCGVSKGFWECLPWKIGETILNRTCASPRDSQWMSFYSPNFGTSNGFGDWNSHKLFVSTFRICHKTAYFLVEIWHKKLLPFQQMNQRQERLSNAPWSEPKLLSLQYRMHEARLPCACGWTVEPGKVEAYPSLMRGDFCWALTKIGRGHSSSDRKSIRSCLITSAFMAPCWSGWWYKMAAL